MAQLKRVLDFKVILLIAINSIIGSGLFFLPAIGARYSGPASLIAWLIAGLISIYVAMCLAKLNTMFPSAGGIYEYSKHAYGRFWSFIVGWLTWLVANITIAMLIVGAVEYLLPYPSLFFMSVKVGISIIFILVLNTMVYRGMKTSAIMLVTFAIITLATVIALIIPSLFHLDASNFSPFFIHYNIFDNLSSIILTIFFVSQAFFGIESVLFLSEEAKDPEKSVSKALVYSVVIVSLLNIALVASTLGAMNYKTFSSFDAPYQKFASALFGSFSSDALSLAIYIVIIGAAAGFIVTTPRLIFALCRDKLFLPQLSEIHKKYNTPYKAIVFQTLSSIIFVLLGFKGKGYETLLNMLVPMALIMMSLAILSVAVIMIKRHDLKTDFKLPLPVYGPLLVVFFYLFLLVIWVKSEMNAVHILKLGIYFILIGVPIYFLLEMYYNPRAVRKTNNVLAYLALITERIALPMSIRKEIIKLLGDIKGKTVLEFGCSVGTLTLHLAEEVGKNGKVYATDISERDLEIARGRMNRRGHKHVKILHDIHHHHRVHPDIPGIHTIVSVGMLGYLHDIKTILRQMNRRLKKGSKICFVDYDKFFDIIPNKDWLGNDNAIKKVFREAGFDVHVERKQGFAWKYIFVYGGKVRKV